MSLTGRILAAQPDIERGEAAIVVACHARDRDDAELLLDALGLTEHVDYQWSLARVALLAVTRCHLGGEFSVNTLRRWIPPRAWGFLPAVFTHLTRCGLAEATGRRERSDSPGAHRRRVPCYRLTPAGEALSAEIAPMPGVGLLTTKIV